MKGYYDLQIELLNILYNPEYCEYRCNPDCEILPLIKLIPHEDERTCLAVHELTGLTPERWDRLTVITRIPWLEHAVAEAIKRARDEAESADSQETPSPNPPGDEAPAGMTWQEAAERMERLRSQGEPWTSHHRLAEQFSCSSRTIYKAIKATPELQAWAKRPTATAPKAQSLNDVLTDHAAQRSEPDPADDAAIREYLESDITPEERAFFHGLSLEDQLDFLDDPDTHQRILGRKA